MGRFVKGDVVVIRFPFSDLSAAKRRPAFVAAVLPGDDVILCQITSRDITGPNAIPISAHDFTGGGLSRESNVRPDKLFTADWRIIIYRAGALAAAKVDEIIATIVAIITG
jgi:mRNA interferase MazF